MGRRGFASMDPAKVRDIASKGGVAAHAKGTAHRFTSEEAREAGRKGGNAPHVRRGGRRRELPPQSAPTAAPESARHTRAVRDAAAESPSPSTERGD